MKNFEDNLQYFITHVDSMRKALPLVMSLGGMIIKSVEKKHDEFMDSEYVTIIEKDEEKTRFSVSTEKVKVFDGIINNLESLNTAFSFMPRSIMVSLVSIYDTLIGNLIETMFEVRPDLLNTLNKEVSFSDILKAASINDLKEDIVAKEINTVLRKSHLEQIEWFEKKLKVTLRSDKELIGRFVEITERRNLFVHCDGKVSNHYINTCKQNNYTFKQEPCIGEKLNVDDIYFNETVNCILEVGIKLSHIIWRKLVPTQISIADCNFADITYGFIEKQNYDLTIKLLEFILSTNQYDAEYELIYLINLSQCYKWSDNDTQCRKLILKHNNWSLYKEKYQIAKHVLLEEYQEVYKLLRKYGNDDNVITKHHIREWPLFKKIRTVDEFISVFEEVYGEAIDIKNDEENEIIEHTLASEEVAVTDCI